MVFKDEEEEFDVKNMVELLSSPLDQLLASHTQSHEGEVPWHGLSCSQQEYCLAKMIYSQMVLVRGLAFSATSKNIVETLWLWLGHCSCWPDDC